MTHIIFIAALFCAIPQLNKKIPFYFFTFSILFLFLALRYNYGNDYMSYYYIHQNINAGLTAWGQDDVLFKYLNLAISNFYWYIVFISFFYIQTIYYLIKNNLKTKEYWFAILILLVNPYLFLIHLSGLRQTIAMCFVIIAINYAIKKNLIIYTLLIIAASGFHNSAILLFPIYFFLNDSKISKKIILLIIGMIIIFIWTPLIDIVLEVVVNYFPQYRYYAESGIKNSIMSILISSFYFLLVLFNINKLEGKEMIYGKLFLIGTIITFLTLKVSMISRVGMYFNIFSIITIPHIFYKMDRKVYKQVLFIIMISIYLLRYISFFNNPMWFNHYFKYTTILG